MKKLNEDIVWDTKEFEEIKEEKELRNIEGGTLGGFTSSITKFFKDMFN